MNWLLFLNAFVFIFLAALPGRTTFLVLLMAARGRPWTLFCGALLAFAVQSFISVALGDFVSFLSPELIQISAGGLFVYFAFHFWRDSRHSQDLGGQVTVDNHSIWSIFLIIFAAEWGDVSQVAIASFSATHHERLTVFIGALFALWSIVVLAVIVGVRIGKSIRIHPRHIQILAAVGFALMGAYLITRGILAWA